MKKEEAVKHYRELLKDYFGDRTVQGQIDKRGRYKEAEWMLLNVFGISEEEVRRIYDEEYWKSNSPQM